MEIEMRVLVIGLGSMGKRRVRCLQALGVTDDVGFDLREDRRIEAKEAYGITTFEQYEMAMEEYSPEAMVISTSPKHHMEYAWDACERGVHCFIEASVVEAEKIKELHHISKQQGVVMAPSCTMSYFPGPKKLKELVQGGAIGRPLNVNYHTGQYLPDWHPWEKIEEFYVSDRETGGGREIVPFELTWLNEIFGNPKPLSCVNAKLTDMNADIDDIYHCVLQYPDELLVNLTVEVISRPIATRELRMLGSEGVLVMSADEECVRYIKVGEEEWTQFSLGKGTVEKDYINPEEPYIEEIRDFLAAVESEEQRRYPNTLLNDYHVLQTLYKLEEIAVELS